MEAVPCEWSSSNICIGEGCYGMECLLKPDTDLVETIVEPLFGKTFVEEGDYIPTWRELFVGRRTRFGMRIMVMRFLRRVKR